MMKKNEDEDYTDFTVSPIILNRVIRVIRA